MDRQTIMETNRSLRNIKNVSIPAAIKYCSSNSSLLSERASQLIQETGARKPPRERCHQRSRLRHHPLCSPCRNSPSRRCSWKCWPFCEPDARPGRSCCDASSSSFPEPQRQGPLPSASIVRRHSRAWCSHPLDRQARLGPCSSPLPLRCQRCSRPEPGQGRQDRRVRVYEPGLVDGPQPPHRHGGHLPPKLRLCGTGAEGSRSRSCGLSSATCLRLPGPLRTTRPAEPIQC